MNQIDRITDKTKPFMKYLAMISDMDLINQVIYMLEYVVPNYFFIIPSSTTGKYHPQFALGEGGLVRHTCAAVEMALQLRDSGLYDDLLGTQAMDVVIASLVLHDTFKLGRIDGQEYITAADHPFIAADEYAKTFPEADGLSPYNAHVYDCILKHMGMFVPRDWPHGQPEDEIEVFVHLCDYIVSRKIWDIAH